jgi:hypothetical protein
VKSNGSRYKMVVRESPLFFRRGMSLSKLKVSGANNIREKSTIKTATAENLLKVAIRQKIPARRVLCLLKLVGGRNEKSYL